MKDLTGKWYLRKRLFGGFDLMVEHEVDNGCPWDFSFVRKYSKGNSEDAARLGVWYVRSVNLK